MAHDLLAVAHSLAREGEAFAIATVVRCERPTSAKPGAKALIRTDGTVLGWVGGSCAEPVVVKEALRALQDGQPRLLALVGEGGTGPVSREGVREYTMACHSGGTLEIFVEPFLPQVRLLLVGHGPVVETLARLGEAMDMGVTVVPSEAANSRLPELAIGPRTFLVVVTYGTSDEEALEQALRSDAGYVSLVASPTRAGAVIETLRARGVPADRLSRLKAPAGLDIGAVTPREIAASIMAEVVQVSRTPTSARMPLETAAHGSAAPEVVDPVCGMSVEIASAAHRSEAGGRTFYFCSAHCKRTFDQNSAHFVGSVSGGMHP
jgi:xanthine dehydrogenase accessory factor